MLRPLKEGLKRQQQGRTQGRHSDTLMPQQGHERPIDRGNKDQLANRDHFRNLLQKQTPQCVKNINIQRLTALTTMIPIPLNSRQNKALAKTLNGEANNISANQHIKVIKANNKANNKAIKANNKAIKANNKVIKANSKVIKANNKVIKANNKVINANNKVNKANNKVNKANNKVSKATNKVSKANNKVSKVNNKTIIMIKDKRITANMTTTRTNKIAGTKNSSNRHKIKVTTKTIVRPTEAMLESDQDAINDQ
jgi:hypothetical protein